MALPIHTSQTHFPKEFFKQQVQQEEQAKAWRAKLQQWRAAGPKVAAGGIAASSGEKKAKRTAPQKVPKELHVKNATPLLPPGACSLFESPTEHRLRAFYPHNGSRLSTSCSLHKFSVHEATRWCIQWLWWVHSQRTGQQCEIAGLMDGFKAPAAGI